MEQTQRLGRKVFYYYLYKNIALGVFLLILSIILASLKEALISKLILAMSPEISIKIMGYLVSGFFIISLFVLIVGFLISWLKYISCSFVMGEHAFSIRRGILSKKEISIPYRQIQDATIEQSLMNRMLGVAKLVIQTAGNDNEQNGEGEGLFRIIDINVAKELKETLLHKNGLMTSRIISEQAPKEPVQ